LKIKLDSRLSLTELETCLIDGVILCTITGVLNWPSITFAEVGFGGEGETAQWTGGGIYARADIVSVADSSESGERCVGGAYARACCDCG
jgi:hypothetical protein